VRLSKRVLHLMRALVSPRPAPARPLRDGSPARLEGELQRMRAALERAAARRQRLEQELAEAERQGQQDEAVRLRRMLAELVRSMEQLQTGLDRLAAQLELVHSAEAAGSQAAAHSRPTQLAGAAPGEAAAPAAPARSDDLEARKARLSGSGGPQS